MHPTADCTRAAGNIPNLPDNIFITRLDDMRCPSFREIMT
jgi:hypothetical protein